AVATVLKNGAAGRMLISIVALAACGPDVARNVQRPTPGCPVTRSRQRATASRPAAIVSGCVPFPTTSSPGEVSMVASTAACAPPSSIVFVTSAVTSNSSPGAAKYGSVGCTTNGPRTSVRVSATPIAVGFTPTATTRSVPLNVSGTG